MKTYQHLLEYLIAKVAYISPSFFFPLTQEIQQDPERIGIETLDFEGKNKVLFYKPEFLGVPFKTNEIG